MLLPRFALPCFVFFVCTDLFPFPSVAPRHAFRSSSLMSPFPLRSRRRRQHALQTLVHGQQLLQSRLKPLWFGCVGMGDGMNARADQSLGGRWVGCIHTSPPKTHREGHQELLSPLHDHGQVVNDAVHGDALVDHNGADFGQVDKLCLLIMGAGGVRGELGRGWMDGWTRHR